MASTTISDMTNENITKTVTRWINETQASVPADYTKRLHTTLNYKYNNFPNAELSGIDGVSNSAVNHKVLPPLLMYFGIGINGFYNVDDGTGAKAYKPSADELDLYEPIPFRMVPKDEDEEVMATEREKYRMRVSKTVNGTDYWCYYLKIATLVDNSVKLTRTDPLNQEETAFELDYSKLAPTPIIPSTSGEVSGTLTEVNATIRIAMEWTGKEVLEAINILYNGDLTKAKISEIGIYSGEDRKVIGSTGTSGTVDYLESMYTQLAYKICNTGSTIVAPSQVSKRVFILGNSGTLLI